MRINHEDAWYKLRGRTKLAARLLPMLGGDDTYLDDLVDGVWHRAMVLVQPYWLDGKKLVPFEVWDHHPAGKLLLEVGLAERRETGIYLALTEEQYADWYKALEQRTNAGKANANRPRDEKGHFLPADTQRYPSTDGPRSNENPSADGGRPSEAIESHLSSSLSFSGSSDFSDSHERENARARGEAQPGQTISRSAEGSTYQAPTPLLKPASPAAQPCSAEDVAEARREWLSTLEYYKAGRQSLLPEEELLIARSIQRWGKKPVLYAIWGKRAEPKDPKGGYDPGKNLALRRVLNHQEPDKFERLMNLGIQAHHREVKHGVSS
jgi:hypothetical protein